MAVWICKKSLNDVRPDEHWGRRMIVLVAERAENIPLLSACPALGLNRSTVYARRGRSATLDPSRSSRQGAVQPRALSPDERRRVHAVLTSVELFKQPPAEVYQTLHECGAYLCSVSTMHRSLCEHGESGSGATNVTHNTTQCRAS